MFEILEDLPRLSAVIALSNFYEFYFWGSTVRKYAVTANNELQYFIFASNKRLAFSQVQNNCISYKLQSVLYRLIEQFNYLFPQYENEKSIERYRNGCRK